MTVIRRVLFLLLASLLLIAGCSRGPQLGEVEGVIRVNGKPIEKIHIEFWPEASAPRSMGLTDAEGRYTLMTDDGKRKGAVVGGHKVILRDVGIWNTAKYRGRDAENVDLNEGRKSRIPVHYADIKHTNLRKEVSPGKNQIDFDIKYVVDE